ncbi:MAG TPA: hypothetical protein VGP72_04485 [Planctomycetota bacterium]|jgi:hypothetical protein
MTNTEKRLRTQIDQLKLKPFPHVLDKNGMLAGAYGVSHHDALHVVILDAEGKVTRSMQNQGIEKLAGATKGLLGELKAPANGENAAHLYAIQQFDQLDAEIAKLGSSADVKAFKDGIKTKTDEYTKKRVPEIATIGEKEPYNAVQEIMSFMRAFPKCKEASAAQSLFNKLNSSPEVKKENDAERAYLAVVAPEVTKATTLPVFDKKVKPLMEGYMGRFGETKYATAMKTVTDNLRKSMEKQN